MDFPIFFSVPRRLTHSSAWHQHIPFAMHLVEALRPGVIVELGAHKGDSYCAFCQAVQQLKLPARCFAVDTWGGDDQAGFFGSEVLADLRAHHDPLYGGFSKLLQCSFDDALTNFPDGTIDLLHIDGYHAYEAVKHDFESWLPKMSRGGILLLHDTNVRERNFGVWRLWDEVKQKYPSFEFLHGHGLGVLAPGGDWPAALDDLFESSEQEAAQIRKFFFQLGERLTLQIRDAAELEQMRTQLADKERQLDQIYSSTGWKALQSYYRLRDGILPEGSFPRKLADIARRLAAARFVNRMNIKKFIWYCRLYGFSSAIRLTLQKLRQPSPLNLKIKPLSPPGAVVSSYEEEPPPINKKVSVVIPTKNAGPDFRFLLRKLKSQKGLRECEIIVVDSGSTDGTIQSARSEGATIVEIPPESFNHAFSRNTGAERATGDYVLFLVQDALPLTDRWLWELTGTLERNNTVAVSCAEYPRADCDLFYQHLIWNHYRTLNLDKDRFLSWDESCSSQLGLRSNSQISDIAALIKLDVFNQYKFKAKFAEDLDLGIRLIKDGRRIGFLYSTRVLHSHDRPAYYFFKRAYVDSKFVKEVFPDMDFPAIRDQARLFRDATALYYRTRKAASAISNMKTPEETGGFFDRIRRLYSIDQVDMEDPAATTPEDEFESFMRSLAISAGAKNIRFRSRENMLLPGFLQHLGVFQAFISESRPGIDPALAGDLSNALFKILALRSGAHMACLYLTLFAQKQPDEFWTDMDRRLVAGV